MQFLFWSARFYLGRRVVILVGVFLFWLVRFYLGGCVSILVGASIFRLVRLVSMSVGVCLLSLTVAQLNKHVVNYWRHKPSRIFGMEQFRGGFFLDCLQIP